MVLCSHYMFTLTCIMRTHITRHKVNKIFWVLQQVARFYVIKHEINCILRHKGYK